MTRLQIPFILIVKTVYVYNKVGHFLSKVHTIKDAARALGIHPKTIRRWEEKGKFIPRRTLGNQRRFNNTDLKLLAQIKAGALLSLPAPRLLTAAEAAAKLQISQITLERWTKAGKLKIRVDDQLQPRYLETDIRAILQGPSLKVTEEKIPPELPSRSVLVGKPTRGNLIVKYAGIAAAAVLLLAVWLLISRPDRIASPAILENQPQTVDLALPRLAQFLDGRITLGLATGDLFYADSTGNIYAKNSALIGQSLSTRQLQLLPGPPPDQGQIGQLYVDQTSGNLKYFDGIDWIDLNRNASNSAVTNQFPYDITLGDLNASASAESLRITLAGDQSVLKVLGGAGQELMTLNDDSLYPILFSQPTRILGNLTAPKLIDEDQNDYFLDPSATDLSLSVAGDASISSTLKFTKYGDYLANTVDDYLIFSGGLGIGGTTSYGFSPGQNLNIRSINAENELTVAGKVAIGTNINTNYKLNVNGNVHVSGNITADGTITPDYVFEPDYPLLSPLQLKEFITKQKHLPGVPSAAMIQKNGINITQMLMALLEKTEENTLYILDLYEKNSRIISPTVETEVLTTKMISPLTDGQIIISGNASVSGTLYAQEIESGTIDRLREKISELAESYTSKVKEVPALEVPGIATTAADIFTSEVEMATDSGHLSLSSLEAETAFFKDFLAVLGQTTLTDLTVNGNLNAGLILAQKIEISGDLLVAGAITAKEIKPLPSQELAINIATGSALSIYSDISPLATFSGQTVSLANLKLETSGTATIAAGANNTVIAAPKISDKSQIIVTFTSDYTPATKYWVKKDPAASLFTLFTNYPLNNDTTLDWLMIN